jgi:photosystem II stability/assembly factor-like uncharacterized protein
MTVQSEISQQSGGENGGIMKRSSPASLLVRFVLLFVVFLPAATARAGFNRWTSIGPAGGLVTAVAIDTASPVGIYAGTEDGIFRSVDGGSSWIPANAGLSNRNVKALCVDRNSNVYAVTSPGVFRSRDRGATWTAVTGGLPNASPLLTVDSVDGSTLYAALGGAIYRSSYSAETWERISAIELGAGRWTVSSLAAAGSMLYLGVERSRCIIFDFCPAVGGTIFRSSDGGASWRSRSFDFPVLSLAVDPGAGSTVYAGFGPALYAPESLQSVLRSRDGGVSWTEVSVGITGAIAALAVSPNSPSVYAGSQDSGIFRTDDGGDHWVRLFGPSDGRAIAVDPTSSSVFVGAEAGLLRRSDDSNWNLLDIGLARVDLGALAFDPRTPSILYLGGEGCVFRSADAGATWIRGTEGLGNAYVQDLAIDPVTPTTLYAATDSGVFRSGDSGTSWAPVNSGLTSLFIADLEIDPADPSIVYAIAPEAGVFRTTNGGERWSAVNNGLTVTQGYSLAVDPVTSTVYAGTYGGVFRSSDHGSTWVAAAAGLTTLSIYDVALAPSLPTTLYAGTGDGLFRTTDAGVSWSRAGLESVSAARIAVHPINPQIVYVATYGTVFRTTDGGVTWTRGGGLEDQPVSRVAVDPHAPSNVYSTTYSGGAFRISFGIPSLCPGGVGACKRSGKGSR